MAAKSPKEMAKSLAIKKLIEIKNGKEEDPKNVSSNKTTIQPYAGGKERTPTGKTNEFVGDFNEYVKVAKERGIDMSNVKSAKDFQNQLYDKLMSSEKGKGILKKMWSDYGVTKKGGGGTVGNPLSDEGLSSLKESFADDKLGGRTKQLIQDIEPEKVLEKPKEDRRSNSRIKDTVWATSKNGVKHAVGFVYEHGDIAFDPKYGYKPVEGSNYNQVVMLPKDSDYMKGEANQTDEDLSKLAEQYKKTHNARSVISGESNNPEYKQEYLDQFKKQNLMKK